MSKEIYISSTPHETRLAIVEKDELTEIYYERENEYTLAGSIYNGRVTRVLPGMQSSFVDIGLERDAFLYITDFMEEAGDSADFEAADGGGRGRGDRSRGRARSDEAAPATIEGEVPVRTEGEGREPRRDRGDRGGRDRNRGRRDERPRAPQGDVVAAPASDEGFSGEADGGDVGEGAPGADGGRRWRGRRGRRRGRGGNEEQQGQPVASVEAGFVPQVDEEGFEEPASFRPVASAPREERVEREREPVREKRGGVRGRLDAIRERFSPRGDRSKREREEETVDVQASSAEPFILPGESLGKYRPREEGVEAQAAKPVAENVIIAKPSTEVVLSGWDGGATLPGETIRPRSGGASESRGSESRGERPREDRPRNDSRGGGNDRRRDRDRNRGRGGDRPGAQRFESRKIDPAEAVLPAVTSQHDVETPLQPFSDDAPAYQTETFEQELRAQAEAHHAHVHEPVEFHETTAEYEPGEDASASFRVDPAGQREFRQSAPEADLAEAAFEDVEAHETAPAEPTHEFTSVQSTGEMLSEASIEAAPQDNENIAAPIEHEAAVQEVRFARAEQTLIPPFDLTSNPMAFAPGDGQLEEETIDDEETDLPHLHASVVDEEMEEETLEGAADLGTMLREMSIDQITRPEQPADDLEDDDFDIDEEDIEEDAFESGEEELSGSDVSEAEEEEFAEAGGFDEATGEARPAVEGRPAGGEGARRGRRDGRRSSRDRGGREGSRDRGSREGSGPREGSSRESGSRDRRGMAGSRSGGRGRHSVQAQDLPAISDLLKPGQEVLVQIAKEPIAKKGARITSHIALPGRFLVFMPTVNHTGVSRKIESDSERRRLKEILLSEKGDASGGFIVRTAASGASEEELRSDLRFLLNLWADIKQRSESSKSPALIYHDLNLIERILRDQVTDNFSAIWVDTETEYERVLRFLQRFQPSLIRRVKLYTKDTPLFEQFGITEEINKALRSKVWLKSGGSIVINQTEALVAIDINTGKFVGKTTKLEDTIVKTNLDAIPEIVRQIRLRDLGGIIIIDFIDMDERKNRNRVMAALEDELKKDRAPSKVLQFNDFGLVAITRKRVKQSLERTLSTTCGICAGTGMVKSPVTVCNDIYIEMRKMHKLIEKGDIMLRVHPEVVKQLKSGSGKWLQEMEEMSGKTILVKSDPALHPEQFDIH
jgi:ribonuclease E